MTNSATPAIEPVFFTLIRSFMLSPTRGSSLRTRLNLKGRFLLDEGVFDLCCA